MDTTETFDVAIVGYGPVGAALAILLGQQGHRVVVLERYTEPYPLPRAVHYDHEVARILQSCGVAEQCNEIAEAVEVYEFRNAEGKALVRFGRRGNGLSGWPQSLMFAQPDLEAVLFARVDELPTVEVRRGWEVSSVVDDLDSVVVRGDAGSVRATYLVGCDGANSTIRSLIGVDMVDKAFFYDWLVVDLIFHEPRDFDPPNVQICDPARPTTVVSGGPGRRRWEFMALPGESVQELNDEATAWRLLAPFDAHPGNARLERHSVYRFQARWLDDWRRGRVLLAGDAAHQTPPFAGQGLCSGIRDAANLAWKLDLVLRDLAPDGLLDAYGPERGPNMRAVIELAIGMGELICVADPEEAAARDAAFIADDDGRITDIPPFPPIAEGVVLAGSPCAGELFLQAEVEVDGRRIRFDDAVGAGWRLVTLADPRLDDDLARWFSSIGGAVVSLSCGPSPVDDPDGAYGSWFAARGLVAALQRPDFAIYGTATAVAEVAEVVRSLRTALAGAT
jgi:2-polyprenyl-6-methoxyphenol hydroxylase-like FAD-dependent oxidoreductase